LNLLKQKTPKKGKRKDETLAESIIMGALTEKVIVKVDEVISKEQKITQRR
jgi:hypothetical protein